MCTLATSLTACKDGPAIDSGISGGRPGSALSGSEQKKLCAAGDAYLDAQFTEEEAHKHTCIARGQLDACELIEECLADHDPVPPRHACTYPLEWSSCDATVAEIEACWVTVFDEVGTWIEATTCTDHPPYPEDFGAACNSIEARCPRRSS